MLNQLKSAFLFLAILGANLPLFAEDAAASKDEKSVKPGINDRFLAENLDVKEWLGRFEIESREVYAHRADVLKACGIKAGQSVADIGAGTGFYARLFAEAVGEKGRVFAVDISKKFLDHIKTRAAEEGVSNLHTVLGTGHETNLKADSVDLVFICDTYHHFEFPRSTLASIHAALRDGGSLVVIDFERIPGKSREFILGHVRADKEGFRAEIQAAGFDFIDEVMIEGFEENYLLRFRKK